jgi:hypothetical protein
VSGPSESAEKRGKKGGAIPGWRISGKVEDWVRATAALFHLIGDFQ